ncbi:MAG: SprT family zinc-dependent metalloprotease [Campylobacterota bacterium]
MTFCARTSAILYEYRPRNRNTYITVTKEGEVCVRSPIRDEQRIRELLCRKEEWIREHLARIHERTRDVHRPGETIRFRGENVPLGHFPALEKKLEKCRSLIDIEKYYHRFYRDEALLTLPSRIEHYVRKTGLKPREIRFKKMRRRWGSCDSKGVVTFNTMMMQLSYEHIDYIIVHELAHLEHMNHSRFFHELVRRYLPEEKRLRRELRGISPH